MSRSRFLTGFAVVIVSVVILFAVPAEYFVVATFASTSCMMLAALMSRPWGRALRISPRALLVGLGSAILLYLIFLAGNAAIAELHPLGMGAANAASIYSLIASSSNPLYLQVSVLLFDSAGYESFFRGVLQWGLQPRLGAGSAPVVAALDAAVHLLTFNPLWVATTFIVDLTWGLTYFFAKDLTASFTSHLVWDVAIFILLPIR